MNTPNRRSLINKDPPLFDQNPDLKDDFLQYAKENLERLSTATILEYVHNVLIPKLVKQEQEETECETSTKEEVLKQYRLTKVCLNTVNNWMTELGFKYSVRKKTYYVDGHEKVDTVLYRKEYIERYFEYERRCYRWIQLSEKEVGELENEDVSFDRKFGYEYKKPNENGDGECTYFEFHIDEHPNFQHICTKYIFGGNLSVRKNDDEKPLILIGQDECIFKQYLFSNAQWCLPDGQRAIIPKDEGQGIMISAFVSREFGYGHDLTTSQLAEINNYRKNRNYIDEDAAVEIYGKKEKKPLTESPFIRKFQYGINNDGYWNYSTMVLQLEDVVDCLHVLYGDRFEFIFFFDHSSGHDRLRPDGLNSNGLNKYYGGGQQKMRKSNIKDKTYLGPFPSQLSIGDTQSFQFEATDEGPFHLSDEERMQRRFDFETGKKEIKNYTRSTLIKKIKENTNLDQVTGNVKEIREIAKAHNVPTSFQRNKVKEGWWASQKACSKFCLKEDFLIHRIQ